jgi:hypothetical protein
MNELEKQVERMLKNYQNNKNRLEMLKCDIQHFSGVTYEDMIESLTYKKSSNERVQTSLQTDRTGNIAIKFREYADTYNEKMLKELIQEYALILNELELLENRVNFLPSPLKKVIVALYFEGMTWSEVEEDHSTSDTQINRKRIKGIIELTKLCQSRLLSQSVSKKVS